MDLSIDLNCFLVLPVSVSSPIFIQKTVIRPYDFQVSFRVRNRGDTNRLATCFRRDWTSGPNYFILYKVLLILGHRYIMWHQYPVLALARWRLATLIAEFCGILRKTVVANVCGGWLSYEIKKFIKFLQCFCKCTSGLSLKIACYISHEKKRVLFVTSGRKHYLHLVNDEDGMLKLSRKITLI